MAAEGEQVRPATPARLRAGAERWPSGEFGQNPVGVTRPGAQQRPAVAGVDQGPGRRTVRRCGAVSRARPVSGGSEHRPFAVIAEYVDTTVGTRPSGPLGPAHQFGLLSPHRACRRLVKTDQAANPRATLTVSPKPIPLLLRFTSTGVVYGVADPAVTGLPVLGVSA
jgi:hypothetical protein